MIMKIFPISVFFSLK